MSPNDRFRLNGKELKRRIWVVSNLLCMVQMSSIVVKMYKFLLEKLRFPFFLFIFAQILFTNKQLSL